MGIGMTVKEAGWKKGDEFDWFGETYVVVLIERRHLTGTRYVNDPFGKRVALNSKRFHVEDMKHARRVDK